MMMIACLDRMLIIYRQLNTVSCHFVGYESSPIALLNHINFISSAS